jgi:hypothetical protein
MVVKREAKPADQAEDVSGRIHTAAYHLWEERGRPEGTALDDWLHAEAHVIGAHPKMKKSTPVPRKRVSKTAAA